MANLDQSHTILSPTELSLLPREELIAQLLKAQEKIQKLEAIKNQSQSTDTISSINSDTINDNSKEESIFAYFSDNSIDSLGEDPYEHQSQVMYELYQGLKNFDMGDCAPSKSFHSSVNEEFIVAYEYKGEFPRCDEDLSGISMVEEEETSQAHAKIVINDETWVEDDNVPEKLEMLPLIPSPVLNTPPYEYIFLTKKNEAKYRIFLNQKLNKVFQEEIQKLQAREEQLLNGKSQYHFDETCGKEQHYQNNFLNKSSETENGNSVSMCNVIHCFDPSDVDLELKKIFMEKPPITHKIVRRKTREERGSSVPAVDSYYGTKDLHKVGHASYFIPTLTESERKAIGWKHEYHYGHWKYAQFNVPNPKQNRISLHPHVQDDNARHTSHYHSGVLHHNPLHHHEIDLTEPLVADGEGDSSPPQCSTSKKHHHHCEPENNNNKDTEDTLSFITLSGGPEELSQSCHIIPDKSTLRKILKWILPCVKLSAHSTMSCLTASAAALIGADNSTSPNEKQSPSKKEKNKNSKKHHEIETIVEPQKKLQFPTSQLSFTISTVDKDYLIEGVGNPEHNQHECCRGEQSTFQPNHHHHHRGRFHWRKILNPHVTSNNTCSVDVVGGDLIESNHDYSSGNRQSEMPVLKVEIMKDSESAAEHRDEMSFGSQVGVHAHESRHEPYERLFNTTSASSTESENDDNATSHPQRRKLRKKLKPCKAYSKLLTLRDLGYETDEIIENENLKSTIEREDLPTDSVTTPSGHNNDREDGLEGSDSKENFLEVNNTKLHDEKDNRVADAVNQDEAKIGSSLVDIPKKNQSSVEFARENDSGSLSSGGSEFPFSSLSISHQNSEIGPDFETQITETITPSASLTEQQLDCIETRFLDPKDLLTPPPIKKPPESDQHVDEDVLPFIFDFYNSNETELSYSEQNDDKVIEWTDCKFVEEIEESLGLLSSCLDSILKHKVMKEKLKTQNGEGRDHYLDVDESEDAPDKVAGQYKITTLNDMEIMGDTENKNEL